MSQRRGPVVLLLALLTLVAGCAEAGSRSPLPAAAPKAPAPPATVLPAPILSRLPPCDPGFGAPEPRAGCPDARPQTGWLSRDHQGRLALQLFRTSTDGTVEDSPVGQPRPFQIASRTVCTGIIRVGYREPLADHVVACSEMRDAVDRLPSLIAVAVWCKEGRSFQVSELYRP